MFVTIKINSNNSFHDIYIRYYLYNYDKENDNYYKKYYTIESIIYIYYIEQVCVRIKKNV